MIHFLSQQGGIIYWISYFLGIITRSSGAVQALKWGKHAATGPQLRPDDKLMYVEEYKYS